MAHEIIHLNKQSSYVSHILYELRDKEIQQDRLRFRLNLEKLGQIMAYEISKGISYETQEIRTQLGAWTGNILKEQPVIVSILRAGLPLHNGVLQFFDRADNGFISAYRHHTKGNDFTIKLEYMAVPDLTDRNLLLIDPMIATGQSIVLCYKALLEMGKPKNLFIAAAIASEEGLEYVQRHLPDAHIIVADIDYELTARSYIVPGLGDAGDLSFGLK